MSFDTQESIITEYLYSIQLHLENEHEFYNFCFGKILLLDELVEKAYSIFEKENCFQYGNIPKDIEIFKTAMRNIDSFEWDTQCVESINDIKNCLVFEDDCIKLPLKWFSDNVFNRVKNILKPFNLTQSKQGKQTIFKFENSDFTPIQIQKILSEKFEQNLSTDFDFFPTPEGLVQKCQDLLDFNEDLSILEPSAGTGSLLKGINSKNILCIEANEFLSKILENKGYNTRNITFEQFGFDKFDRIIMNPPFSNRMDAKHIIRAFENNLKMGGILVAISSVGIDNCTDKNSKNFQELFKKFGIYKEEIPPGAFKDSAKGTNIPVLITKFKKTEETSPITERKQLTLF